jgi:hypothetical protein
MTDAFPRVAPLALLVVILLSGCETQQGRVESSSTPVAVAMAPSSGGGGGVITGAGTYIPPGVTQPTQNYPRTIQESGAGNDATAAAAGRRHRHRHRGAGAFDTALLRFAAGQQNHDQQCQRGDAGDCVCQLKMLFSQFNGVDCD